MGTFRKDGGYSFHGMPGVSDIIGILPQTHAGTLFGNILCVECKRPKEYGGRDATSEQKVFLKKISDSGGIALVVHSVDELQDLLKMYL